MLDTLLFLACFLLFLVVVPVFLAIGLIWLIDAVWGYEDSSGGW